MTSFPRTPGRPSGQVHTAVVGSQRIDLPVVPVSHDLAIALLVGPDHGVRFMERAGQDLAQLVEHTRPDVVAGAATLGVPPAIELTRALGLDDYVVLQKTKKIHLGDALSAPLRSITTAQSQELLLDRARVGAVAGRRVVLVDDVISTGGSIVAALQLLRSAGADVVAVAALFTEADEWRDALGEDADLVVALGTIPLHVPGPDGWVPMG